VALVVAADEPWVGGLHIFTPFPWVDGATIDVSDVGSERPIYYPISPASEPTPVGPPSSASVGIQVGPPLQRTVSVGTEVDLEVLYDDAISPGLPRPRLPWGVRITISGINYLGG